MINCAVARKFLANLPIYTVLVSPQMGLLGDRVDDDRLHGSRSYIRNIEMKAAHLAAALDERQDGLFRRGRRISAVLGFAACESLIALDELSFAAERPEMTFAHRLADTMRHKPSCLVGNPEQAMQLVADHALL